MAEEKQYLHRVEAVGLKRSVDQASVDREQRQEIKERAKELQEMWMKGPVTLVSTSEYRKKTLAGMGFNENNIHLLDNEIDEPAVLAEYLKNFAMSYVYPFRTEAPKLVAGQKVEQSLAHIPGEHLVIAADTLPSTFRYEDGFKAQPMEKPKSKENARERIQQTLETIVREYTKFVNHFRAVRNLWKENGSFDEDEALALNVGGVKPVQINVHTAVALRVPNDTRVWVFDTAVKLFPTKLYTLVEQTVPVEAGVDISDAAVEDYVKQIQPQINDLVNQLMDIGGDRVTKISGGINFADKEARACLGIRHMSAHGMEFLPEDTLSEGVFLGMPAKDELMDALNSIAEEMLSEHIT